MKKGRPKKDITKEARIEIRLEYELKEKYVNYCIRKQLNMSKQLRGVIIKIIKNEK